MKTLTCAECGVEFETTHPRKKYCNRECRRARDKRHYDEHYASKRVERSCTVEQSCEMCDKPFSYKLFNTMRPRRFCSKQCNYDSQKLNPTNVWTRTTPHTDLTAADLRVIEVIWQALGYEPLKVFGGRTDLCEIYPTLFSKELFHEWVVYTIVFQSHLEHRYETVVQIPGLDKAAFLKLCDKYNITLQDSEAFAEDRRLAA